jgi:hypothetical protein
MRLAAGSVRVCERNVTFRSPGFAALSRSVSAVVRMAT